MEDCPFTAGEIVRLKSGGPKMTVAGVDMLGEVICQWFTRENRDLQRSTFPVASLEKVKDGLPVISYSKPVKKNRY